MLKAQKFATPLPSQTKGLWPQQQCVTAEALAKAHLQIGLGRVRSCRSVFLFQRLYPFHTAFLMTGFYLALKLNIWNFSLLGFFSLSWKITCILPVNIFLLCLVSFAILYEFLPSSSLKQLKQLKQTSD